MNPCTTYRAGFTLVETLVALAVFSMVALAAVALLGNTIDRDAQLAQVNDDLLALQRTRAVLRADIGQATWRVWRDESGARHLPLEVAQGDVLLRLVRQGWENPDQSARPDLQRVSYRLNANEELVRFAAGQLDGAREQPGLVLLTGVAAVDLRLHVAGSWVAPGGWPGENGVDDGLPSAIEFTVRRTDGTVLQMAFLTPEAANDEVRRAAALRRVG